jgi:hypothetical protein
LDQVTIDLERKEIAPGLQTFVALSRAEFATKGSPQGL